VFSSKYRMHSASRRRAISALSAVVAALMLISCNPEAKNEIPMQPTQPVLHRADSPLPDRVPGEYIVTVAPGSDAASVRNVYGTYGIREVVDLGAGNFLMKLTRDPGLDEIKQKGLESGKVKTAQPNFIYRTQ